ncbi:MAG: hypothetical protein QM698_13450 [Micropepsaceae bacterium]
MSIDARHEIEQTRLARQRDAEELAHLLDVIRKSAPQLGEDDVQGIATAILTSGFAAIDAALCRLAREFEIKALSLGHAFTGVQAMGEDEAARRTADARSYRFSAEAVLKVRENSARLPPLPALNDPWEFPA